MGLLSERPESEIKSGRFVLDTLWAAIWCVEKTTNYRYAVLKAVDLGDDSDTTASVAGGIAGLIYGIGGRKRRSKQLDRAVGLPELAGGCSRKDGGNDLLRYGKSAKNI
ncbi:MAG: ADP-ribosylglycohydrolase family protein [Parasutterella sp.]